MAEVTLKAKIGKKARKLSKSDSKRRDISDKEFKKFIKNLKDAGLEFFWGIYLDGVIITPMGREEVKAPLGRIEKLKKLEMLKRPSALRRDIQRAETQSKKAFDKGDIWTVYAWDYDLLVRAGAEPAKLIYPDDKRK